MMDTTVTDTPRKKRSVFKIIVTTLVILGLIGALIVYGIFSLLGQSDAAKLAMQYSQQNAQVQAYLGTPIEQGFWVSGKVNVSGSSGNANLAIPVTGSKSTGTVYANAVKRSGKWYLMQLAVKIDTPEKTVRIVANGRQVLMRQPMTQRNIPTSLNQPIKRNKQQ